MLDVPNRERWRRRGEGIFLALAFAVAVAIWPVMLAARALRCRRYRRAIAGSVIAGTARRDDSGVWTVHGREHGRAVIAVFEVVAVRWVVFDDGVLAGRVGDRESMLFVITLRSGEAVRLHAKSGQLHALRDELAEAGLLPAPERRLGCAAWSLADTMCGGVWIAAILALVAMIRR
jgi:hypothetical protein